MTILAGLSIGLFVATVLCFLVAMLSMDSGPGWTEVLLNFVKPGLTLTVLCTAALVIWVFVTAFTT